MAEQTAYRTPDELLTTTEAARLLGIDRNSVWARCKRRTVGRERHGRFWFIPRSEVERLIREKS